MKTRTLNGVDAVRVAVSPLRDVKVRDASGTGDGSWTIEGYAAVTEQETTLYDLSWIRVREEIARGAFLGVLGRLARGDGLVHLNFGHDMNTSIASSQVPAGTIGGLELSEDDHGLRFFARVDAADPDAQRLAVKMQRGVVNQASFAFTIASEELVEEITNKPEDVAAGEPLWDEKWRINEIQDLFDVCACPQGAYAQTESFVRTMAAGSLTRSGIAVPELRRPTPAQRADVASLDCLVDAYQAIEEFIALEQDPEDADDVAKATTILGELDELIQVEAAEPDDGAVDPDEEQDGRAKAGHQRRRRRRGADHVAPSVGVDELEVARAKADATYRTLTRKAVA